MSLNEVEFLNFIQRSWRLNRLIGQRLQQDKSRWGKTDHLITAWLNERQKVLKLYIAATKLPSIRGKPVQPIVTLVEKESLREFCSLLIDYASVLHFEVLEKLQSVEERIKQEHPEILLGLNPELSFKLLRTTNAILHFDELCQKILAAEENTIPSLKGPLSHLGERLAERMDLEDALIHAYHLAKHATKASPTA